MRSACSSDIAVDRIRVVFAASTTAKQQETAGGLHKACNEQQRHAQRDGTEPSAGVRAPRGVPSDTFDGVGSQIGGTPAATASREPLAERAGGV
jgi:hypothetical protein